MEINYKILLLYNGDILLGFCYFTWRCYKIYFTIQIRDKILLLYMEIYREEFVTL
jgi:hypothetical protein